MATSLAAAHHFNQSLKVCKKYLLLAWPARPVPFPSLYITLYIGTIVCMNVELVYLDRSSENYTTLKVLVI